VLSEGIRVKDWDRGGEINYSSWGGGKIRKWGIKAIKRGRSLQRTQLPKGSHPGERLSGERGKKKLLGWKKPPKRKYIRILHAKGCRTTSEKKHHH